jgi:hypothetical protein
MMRPPLIQSMVERLGHDDRVLDRQDGDAAIDLDLLRRPGEIALRRCGTEVKGARQLDMLVGDDVMLGNEQHLIAEFIRPLRHPRLIGAGDAELPRVRQCLQLRRVGQGKCELHPKLFPVFLGFA